MKKRSFLCVLIALVMALGIALPACKTRKPSTATEYTVSFDVGSGATAAGVSTPESQTVKAGGTAVQPTIDVWEGHTFIGWYKGTKQWNFSTDTVNSNMTLKAEWNAGVDADTAKRYEEELTWGQADHLYIHYMRGAHSSMEQGTVNSAEAPGYSSQIESDVYGDWGLWVWEYFPTNSEGRAFYPMKIDESGAVYDIDLKASYSDAGWNETALDNKGLTITYADALRLGIQVYSQDSRINGSGFWVNDGGDVYVVLEQARREKGDYHWFVRQGNVGSGTATFTDYVVYDPYAGLEPGSATTKYDVVSNKGNNTIYAQQPVAEGWEENSVGYQVFIASFADGNGDGMGDLRGVINKLDYLEELGVDTLWLTPFQTSNSYHGYDIMDYFTVDPRFGTLDDYRELVYKAHQKGMKVLMDFVLNHTSPSNPWFIKSQNLVKEKVKLPDGTEKEIDYRNFYTWQNDDYVNGLNATQKAQWFKDSNGYYFYSSFGSSMPELNFDYQATRDAILEVALYWMSFGLDGFRLDAVKHIYMANESRDSSDRVITDVSDSGDYSFDMKKNAH
ncbi:MAG: InlB B-repeat-containing protein, partial [Clostridia bacterium]|nr:InlB B-repeat-containing protein [Clostridia bacterium]